MQRQNEEWDMLLHSSSMQDMFEWFQQISAKRSIEDTPKKLIKRIHQPIHDLLFSLSEEEKLFCLKKIYMTYTFFCTYTEKYKTNPILHEEFKEYSNIAEAIYVCVYTLKNITNTPEQLQEVLKKLNRDSIFHEFIHLSDINTILKLNFTIKKNLKSIVASPYVKALIKLRSILHSARKHSHMMHYIDGDPDTPGQVKTKKGLLIDSLQTQLKKIYFLPAIEDIKLDALKDAVLDIYWHLRENQGWTDSYLANVLEFFLNKPKGLNLAAYGKTYVIGHHLSEKMIIPSVSQAVDLAYDHLKQALKNQPSFACNHLYEQIENIKNEDRFSSSWEKLIAIKREIITTYFFFLDKKSISNVFFHQHTLVPALGKFMHDEFDMSKEKMNRLYTHIKPDIEEPDPHFVSLRIGSD